MAKSVKIELETETTGAGYVSGVGFVLLPVAEAFVFLNAMPSRAYESISQGGLVILAILAVLHAATIPGMIFGRKMRGTISIVEQPDPPTTAA